MNSFETIDVPVKSRGIPLWSALLTLGVFLLAAAAALAYILYTTQNERRNVIRQIQALEKRQIIGELEQGKGIEEAKLTTARTAQNDVRAQARNATTILEPLLAEADQLAADASALKSNEAGRQIALHPDLLLQARRLYESDLRLLASHADIVSKLENARRIDQQISGAAGTAYEPDPQFLATLQHAALWGEQELSKVRQMQATVSALAREAKVKVSDKTLRPDSPTLETALVQLAQTESAIRQRLITEQTEQAKPQAIDILVQAAVKKSLDEARLQANNMLAGVRDLIQEQQRQDMLRQAEQSRLFAETRLQITNLVTRLQDLQAEQHREAVVHQADEKIQDKRAEVIAEDKRQEALKIALRQRASDPALKALLAPFITPSFHQLKGNSYEKAPLSYTALLSCGALEATPPGVTKLVQIATYAGDDRPRWELRGGRLGWGHFEESIEKAKDAQKALNELGPVLVELGMLSP